MKTTLLNRMGSFILGGGTGVAVALTGLLAWTGTGDLESIKNLFDTYNQDVESDMSEVVSHYSVTVDNANAEIGEYQVALQQANDNISQLITAYENKVDELENANTKYEEDLAELEYALSDMQVRLDQQYEADMNAIIEQANAEIQKANEEVAETNEYITNKIVESDTFNKSGNDRIAETGKALDTDGDKTVQDISSIVPSEQPQE